MTKIIDLCLKHYKYICDDRIQYNNLKFYKKTDTKIASYFLIYQIDCTDFETDSDKMKSSLDKLEINYFRHNDGGKSIKLDIQNSFDNNLEASQIDKNTSAIYLLKFNDIGNLKLHRNLVYAIEESPNYFKRYILPYTKRQVDKLLKIIDSHGSQNITEVLSEIANDENQYYKLMEGQNIGDVYEFVIRLFSKIPFLQYQFSENNIPQSIETEIMKKVEDAGLTGYHKAIESQKCTIDDLLEIVSSDNIDVKEIEAKLNRLLGGSSDAI
jgi:DNA-binding protein Fis